MPARLIHGHGNRPDYYYNLWKRIKQCCYDQNYQAYHNYGGRGIQMKDDWRQSFECFLSGLLEDIGTRPGSEFSIDRKDNDGNYEPGNVKWSTRKEQGRNRRGNRPATALGHTRTIAEWSEITGNRWYNIERRLDAGWDELRAVYEPERVLPRKEARFMAKRIEAEIDENGEVTLEVKGATGSECEEMTADLEKALGKTTDRKRKREYYQQKQSRDQEARM